MKQTKKNLELLVQALNTLLHEQYVLEVLEYELFGPYRFRLTHPITESMPLCTWDRMTCVEMYQYLRGVIAGVGAGKSMAKEQVLSVVSTIK